MRINPCLFSNNAGYEQRMNPSKSWQLVGFNHLEQPDSPDYAFIETPSRHRIGLPRTANSYGVQIG